MRGIITGNNIECVGVGTEYANTSTEYKTVYFPDNLPFPHLGVQEVYVFLKACHSPLLSMHWQPSQIKSSS